MKANSGADKGAIEHHYDVSNEFYALWLDSSLTYSCALWDNDKANDTLEAAQLRKLDYHITQSAASNALRVLDIGCGWGSMLRRLVEEGGVESAVGITLSSAQANYMSRLHDPRVDVQHVAWQDHQPIAQYDAIISVGAFEHFARLDLNPADKVSAYRLFFQKCHEWLKDGGRMSLQSIAYGNAGKETFSRFFAEYIFPDSDLPHLSDIAQAVDRRFEVVSLRNDRMQYAQTFREWLKRLRDNRGAAVTLVGEDVVKRYEKYFKLCIVSFDALHSMTLLRITLQRIDRPCL